MSPKFKPGDKVIIPGVRAFKITEVEKLPEIVQGVEVLDKAIIAYNFELIWDLENREIFHVSEFAVSCVDANGILLTRTAELLYLKNKAV